MPQSHLRAINGLRPLQWSQELAVAAQTEATLLAATDCPATPPPATGIEATSGPAGSTDSQIIDQWVAEGQYYDYASNTCAAGHTCAQYTQIVWKNTTSVGCADATARNGALVVTCVYSPPGDIPGQRPY
ncbi:CAP domain-containing protein [Kitasatospora purpeofusca]|uniref:CAP domain-containing protein n=1 Tax=Kitasatospora purpeofusca TaxID=67352 RepID=UPI0038191500